MSSVSQLLYPIETVGHILEIAWTAALSPIERKALYDNLSAAHPRLHDIIRHVARRYVMLDCTLGSLDGIKMCRASIEEAESGGGSTPIPTFQHSDIRLIVPLITNQDARRAELPIHKLPAADPILDYLRDVIRDCRSFTLDTSQPHHLVDQMVPIRLLAILASFQSLTHIAWDCVWSPPDIFAYVKDPLVPMPALSSLRLKHIPACECIPGAMANREDGHCNACLRSALFDTFPNLRHLHLENPVFLKDLKPPHSIETLTLDAPPLKRIVGREPYSSVIDYNIPAALRRGFMCWPKKGNTQRKIVVRAGVDTPYGWASAATACAEANIRLEKVVAYLRAIEVEQEGHNEIQYRFNVFVL